MAVADYPSASLEFSAWFFNDGGSGSAPNDTFKIFASNGQEKALITQITGKTGDWSKTGPFSLSDFITLNNDVAITFEATDQVNNGHLVEAGLDAFSVELGESVSVEDQLDFEKEWVLYPNPVEDRILINNEAFSGKVTFSIFNAEGKLISTIQKVGSDFSLTPPVQSGIYFLNIKAENGAEENLNFVKL
jgi:hypothetical protein